MKNSTQEALENAIIEIESHASCQQLDELITFEQKQSKKYQTTKQMVLQHIDDIQTLMSQIQSDKTLFESSMENMKKEVQKLKQKQRELKNELDFNQTLRVTVFKIKTFF